MKSNEDSQCCCCCRKFLKFLLPVALLFGWFVWPTLYKPTIVTRWETEGRMITLLYRENRITGKVEDYRWSDQKWGVWGQKSP